MLSAASEAIHNLIVPPERRILAESPITRMKDIKNPVEMHGMHEANIRDSVAVIQYFYWLDSQIDAENITEQKGVEKLRTLKRYDINLKSSVFLI